MRLNQLPCEHRFDDFTEAECATFSPVTMDRPVLPPGIYFRGLLIGYFEGIDSERGIAWRATGSFALRDFLGVGRTARRQTFDDFAHASTDRSGNTSRCVHMGAAVPEHGRLG